MKVGLVELAFHNEVLRSYINIFKELADDITCFTNKFCHDQIYDYQDDSEINWVIKEQSSNKNYFQKHHEALKSCDVIIITTLDDDLDFFANYDWPTKTILLVHDYYAYFEPNQINYSGTLKEKARATKSWLNYHTNQERKKLDQLMDKMDYLAVPSISVLNFVSKREGASKITKVLDFAIPNKQTKTNTSDVTKIVIPGNVIPKSRNYKAVINALGLAKDELRQTELVILGQARTSYGRKIINQLSALEGDTFVLKYYDSFIHQREFDEQLRLCDFLLLPISKVMRYRHFKEMNGFTCVSGNINDMLYFGKPAIMPKFYPLDPGVETMVERYKDEQHLSELLVEWTNGRKYLSISDAVPNILKNQRAEVIERFKAVIS